MRFTRSIAIGVWLVCGIASDARAQLKTMVQATGFSSPVTMVQDPTDRTVQFVVEQGGRIGVIRGGTVLSTDFLDFRGSIAFGGEQGLLGLAFAPDYATSRRFFVNFTNPGGNTVIARFLRRSADPVVADPSTRFDLHWGGAGNPGFIAQPFANHNGGNIVFGPDGFLYIGMGDGGSGDDPDHRAQNPAELLGKMLRIDVNVPDSNPSGYVVPADNPFVSGPVGTRPEIWSFGLRNPWKFSFDGPARGGTGALVIGDVGQSQFEEIDYEPVNRGGRNYGWRNREFDGDGKADLAFYRPSDGTWNIEHSTSDDATTFSASWGASADIPLPGDYDGDGQADLAVYRPSTGTWFVLQSSADYTTYFSTPWGMSTDILVSGDCDGDGKADLAFYRPSNGNWYVLQSSSDYSTSIQVAWGRGTDTPLPKRPS